MSALFEHSPWVEQRADARPSSSDRHADLMAVLHDATAEEQLALIRAHPELAGKAAIDKTLTDASAAEQAYAGLDRLTAAEYARFHALNAAYRARFDFPFIICVRLTDKAGILRAMEERLAHDRETEIATALAQIGEIVRLRLEDIRPPIGLPALEAELARQLVLTGHGGADWTRPRAHPQGHVHDVVIVGGGQSGLAAAFGLLRERVSNLLVIDESPAGYEGPWDTYARMITLRTPKELNPIDFGLPALSYRAWWEAQHGARGWAALDKIARGDWMDYLRWYRRVLALPVRNDTRLTLIEPLGDGLHRLHLDGQAPLLARKIVLATGIQGGGEWHVPAMISDAVPRRLYAHTSEPIDLAALVGKRIGILGGGASAFDNANAALTQGVGEAHVFLRRAVLPRINPIRFMERVGFTGRYPALSDADKYAVMAGFLGHNQPPTNDTFDRAAAHAGFALHLGAPWLSVEASGDGVRVTTPHGEYDFDFIILSTGLVSDPGLRPELGRVADRIARWADRFTPAAGSANALIDAHPYLGAGFELLPREEEDADTLHGLFAFNYSALISLGLSASALSGLRTALPRLVKGVTDQLFLDDREAMVADLLAYDEAEFLGEWPRQEAAA